MAIQAGKNKTYCYKRLVNRQLKLKLILMLWRTMELELEMEIKEIKQDQQVNWILTCLVRKIRIIKDLYKLFTNKMVIITNKYHSGKAIKIRFFMLKLMMKTFYKIRKLWTQIWYWTPFKATEATIRPNFKVKDSAILRNKAK